MKRKEIGAPSYEIGGVIKVSWLFIEQGESNSTWEAIEANPKMTMCRWEELGHGKCC
jgi:hypothetical protein